MTTDMPWAKLPRWIVTDGMLANLSPAETKTLMIIVTLTDQQGFTNPSNSLIAQAAGLSERAVRDAVKGLKAKECIEIVEPARGRKPSVYRVDSNRRPEHSFRLNTPIDRNAASGQARPEHSFRLPASGLRGVDRNTASGLDTYIGTRVRRREEREINNSLSLPDYVIQKLWDSFPNKLIPNNWSEANFKGLREKIESHPLTTHIQIDKLYRELSEVRDRNFPVPSYGEVVEKLAAIEAANIKRERNFKAQVTGAKLQDNREQYAQVIETLDESGVLDLFEKTRQVYERSAQEAASQIWDQTTSSMYKHALRDLLIDPECDQFAACGLRHWVITTYRRLQKESA